MNKLLLSITCAKCFCGEQYRNLMSASMIPKPWLSYSFLQFIKPRKE
jgi:hypothetical protein